MDKLLDILKKAFNERMKRPYLPINHLPKLVKQYRIGAIHSKTLVTIPDWAAFYRIEYSSNCLVSWGNQNDTAYMVSTPDVQFEIGPALLSTINSELEIYSVGDIRNFYIQTLTGAGYFTVSFWANYSI